MDGAVRRGIDLMTEHPNAKLVERCYKAFANDDVRTLAEVVDATVVWHQPGRSPLGGDHIGPDGLRDLLEKFGTLSGGTFKLHLVDILATASRAIALHEMTACRGDRVLDMASAVEFEIHLGKITEVTVYHDDTYHFDEFWS
jgi:ketosteroid isomerase-like protein